MSNEAVESVESARTININVNTHKIYQKHLSTHLDPHPNEKLRIRQWQFDDLPQLPNLLI